MKNVLTILLILFCQMTLLAQTLYAPGGTVGNNSTNFNVGIGTGTTAPTGGKLQIIADASSSNALRLELGAFSMGGYSPFSIDANGVFGGRFTVTNNGYVGIGTPFPLQKLHIKNGSLMASDPSFDAINVRIDATQVPTLQFTRWTGGGSTQHNAFVGQFFNSNLQEYSFGIGTGNSSTGDQNFTNMIITTTLGGNVGIGTTSPDALLAVKGQVHAQEVKVDLNGAVAPDYVFSGDYKLASLEEIKTYIDENKHLPEVPSAKEMEKNGVQLGEMNMLLLKKIEELTLYVIGLKKENQSMRNELRSLKTKNKLR